METTVLQGLGDRQVRLVYLITYSQADETIVPDRRAFTEMVLSAFSALGSPVPMRWSCCQESHIIGGIHCHMATKLQVIR